MPSSIANNPIGPSSVVRRSSSPSAVGLSTDQSFGQPVREFFSYCKIECGFAPATLSAYAADLRDLWVWLQDHGHVGWESLRLDTISHHLRDLHARGLALSTISRHVATMRVFGRYLSVNHHVAQNPTELLVQPARWQSLPGVLGTMQMLRLLDTPQPGDALFQRDAAMMELMYAGGLRASEVADLDLDRLHLNLGVARVLGKGGKERIVPVGKPAIAAAERYLNELRPKLIHLRRDTDRLLLSRSGAPITRVVVWQIVTKYARRAGLGHVHPHTLRHSFATHLLAGGADLRVVQELLGHTNINTTQIYTHVDKSQLKKIIAKYHPRP